MNKTMTKIGAVSAAALIASMGVAPSAFAATDLATGVTNPYVSKQVQGTKATDVSGKTFQINFTQVAYAAGGTVNVSTGGEDAAAISAITMTVPEALTGTNEYLSFSSQIALNDVTFPHAGVYAYEVTETVPTTDNGISYNVNDNAYVLMVAVTNKAAEGVEISQVSIRTKKPSETVEQVLAKTGSTDTLTDAGAKVTGDQVQNADKNNANAVDGKMAFTNVFDGNVRKSAGTVKPEGSTTTDDTYHKDLVFTKTVKDTDNDDSGLKDPSYADKTKEFTYSLTVNFPHYAYDTTKSDDDAVKFTGKVTKGGTDVTGTNKTVSIPANAASKTVTFTLKDGETMTLDSLPVGTTYSIKETGDSRYYANAVPTVNGTAIAGTGGPSVGTTVAWKANKGADLELKDETNHQFYVGMTTDNKVDFYNAFDSQSISPTGIVTQALPYALVVAIAGVGIVVMARRRKGSQE